MLPQYGVPPAIVAAFDGGPIVTMLALEPAHRQEDVIDQIIEAIKKAFAPRAVAAPHDIIDQKCPK